MGKAWGPGPLLLAAALLAASCQEGKTAKTAADEGKPESATVKLAAAAKPEVAKEGWTWCGWSGGGFFWSAAFHPAQDGVIYMGGDVAGVYKTADHGQSWRMINNGLANYGVYSLAVDRQNPQTVYAATVAGLCKSADGGESWRLMPQTGPKELRITGERGLSVRPIAVDPSDSNIVYAGSPGGAIYKSLDGAQTWKQIHQVKLPAGEAMDSPTALRAQFGGKNSLPYGGFWIPAVWPKGIEGKALNGFGFSFKGNGVAPKKAYLSLRTADGAKYDSRNLSALFEKTDWQDVWLAADDFVLDPEAVAKHAGLAGAWPKLPDWRKIRQVDFSCVNLDSKKPSVALFGTFFSASGGTGNAERVAVRDFANDKSCHPFGNIAIGGHESVSLGTVFSVAVAAKNPSMVLAATEKEGIILSMDGGSSWRALPTPSKATSVAVADTDTNIILGAFDTKGIWKSVDQGNTWINCSQGIRPDCAMRELAISPANKQNVYAIGSCGWSGYFYASNDGGKTWTEYSRTANDHDANPTYGNPVGTFSALTNLAMNPANPQELFVSGNWRPYLSKDGGKTWMERVRGADISCVQDIFFLKGRAFAVAMDEGLFESNDGGAAWRQLIPRKWDPEICGHQWRIWATEKDGNLKTLSTCSPWDAVPNSNRVLISEDGGKSFSIIKKGLPGYVPHVNCMWGRSFPRALAIDPTDANIIYLGMDGDPEPDKNLPGGGVFKSVDGGYSWTQLPSQPASRRMFFGLAADPKNAKRLYWGACGSKGGLYVSEDAGANWKRIKDVDETWVFNVAVTPKGTAYCSGNNLWASSDGGTSWKKLTDNKIGNIVGIAFDPSDEQRVFISCVDWSSKAQGAVLMSADGGRTWQDITRDIPYRKPILLRYNLETKELWAAGAGIFKLKI